MTDLLSHHSLDLATRYLDLAGVFASALLGGAIARVERLDLFGFLAVGIASGLGGGIIRDVLLQHGTPVALTDVAYLPTAIAGSLIAFAINIGQHAWDRLFTALDAAVIGFWGVTGAHKTLAAGLGWLPAVLLGTMSAVGGGVTRDLMLGRVPAVFGGNAMYATVAAITSGIMVLCSYLNAPALGIILGIVVGLIVRVLAVRHGWGLPNGRDWQPHSRLATVWQRGRRAIPRRTSARRSRP
ncbi:trimeric intracellular cation channel family protein [Streptomyces boninensis]|uniref:trimeric intracellular cation channel family protein n=1 Tax=Streptomyces boninensis TaxID=2039455 RepID=UPI003B214369